MATPNTVDRQAQLIWLILVILGAFLAAVGWYRWASAATPSSGQQNAAARAAVMALAGLPCQSQRASESSAACKPFWVERVISFMLDS